MNAKPETISWHERARSLSLRTQAFIAGRYVDAASGVTFDSINPATGKLLARVASGDTEDINRAVAAARAVFRKGSWANLAPAKRKRALLRFAELITKHTEELALLETLDMGKPITDSLKVDIPGAARCVQWYAEAVDKIYDEVAPTGPAALATITREPLGVVGAIVPWNFPLLMAAWKIAPILAAGNSLVLKPSEKSPLTALKVAELAVEAGIPPGVLNVVPGFGQTAGKALALHMDVDCIAFTGSTATGKTIMQYAGQSNLKRVSLECGGKSPNIVMADYPDLEKAATAAAYAIFYNQGEVCSAGSRLLLQEGIKDAVLEKVQAIGRTMQPGDPLDAGTRLGAIVDETQMKRVLGYIDAGRRDGAICALVAAACARTAAASSSSRPCSRTFARRCRSRARRSSGRCSRPSPSRPWRRRSRSRTTWSTDWPPRCGRAMSPPRTAWRAPSVPARSTSTATT